MQDEDTSTTGGRRTISREELYALVWQTPMSRLAKSFGLSDVSLRKICVKHDIPTPKLGYWAKPMHGKHAPSGARKRATGYFANSRGAHRIVGESRCGHRMSERLPTEREFLRER